MMLPWDDFPLDLSDPEEDPNYEHLIGRLPYHLPLLLNRFLTSHVPLTIQRQEGVIIAQGYTRVPAKYHDETCVNLELLLSDEWGNIVCFDFGARMDHSVMRAWDRRRREHPERAGSMKKTGLFGPARINSKLRNQNIRPEETHKRNSEIWYDPPLSPPRS
jgi:hypothetical protein